MSAVLEGDDWRKLFQYSSRDDGPLGPGQPLGPQGGGSGNGNFGKNGPTLAPGLPWPSPYKTLQCSGPSGPLTGAQGRHGVTYTAMRHIRGPMRRPQKVACRPRKPQTEKQTFKKQTFNRSEIIVFVVTMMMMMVMMMMMTMMMMMMIMMMMMMTMMLMNH